MIFKLDKTLLNALNELEDWLIQNDKTLELHLIGAIAVSTYLEENRHTLDIDTYSKILDESILNRIESIAEKNQLPIDWLNDRSSTIALPENIMERSKLVYEHSHLKINIASRIDLIALKAAAFVNRGNSTLKDFEDLKKLKPNIDELDFAVNFVKKYYTPPVLKNPWLKQFNESIKVLYELVK